MYQIQNYKNICNKIKKSLIDINLSFAECFKFNLYELLGVTFMNII